MPLIRPRRFVRNEIVSRRVPGLALRRAHAASIAWLTIAAELSTALGVGANTAIFSVAHALLLRPLTMVIILMGIAAAASYIPARRAARIDPIISLRSE